MREKNSQLFQAIGEHLTNRRAAILEAWRMAADADPEQTTIASLTRSQFNDHIPQVLDAFERKLSARPGGDRAIAADEEMKLEEVKHGLHRWQQGYRLRELMHEWGHLHLCLYDELQAYAATHPELDRDTLTEVIRELTILVHKAISESTAQYARLQQDEAAGHLRDLQQALQQTQELENLRARLMHQAVHDLGGNVQTVSTTASLLSYTDLPDDERSEYVSLLQRSTGALGAMLRDLMSLARLEAGQERRTIAPFDAATLLTEFCRATRSLARTRHLYLEMNGPDTLPVEGDTSGVRRIVQNLVHNALKYTEQGGVTVSWTAENSDKWSITVQDTGPGLLGGPGSPILAGLKAATASARESDEKEGEKQGEPTGVLALPASDPNIVRGPSRQQHGEGIGLSIVKRLCELLDASLELVSSADSGTTFRVLLPRHYESAD